MRPAVLATPTNKAIVPTLPTTLLGSAGMSRVEGLQQTTDTVQQSVTLPFSVPLYGTNYSTIWVTADGWMGVTNQTLYSGFSTTIPNFRNIQISASDGNMRYLYGLEDATGQKYRLRFEGNATYNGGGINKIYEITLTNTGHIAIVTGTLGTQTAAERISKGDGVKFTELNIVENAYIHLRYDAATDNYVVMASGSS